LVDILSDKTKLEKIINNPSKVKAVEAIIPKDFILFHIEELTFEDKSPRKEALENVISAIRLEVVNFVYMLLGDKNGVSFYFGIVKDKNYFQALALDVDDIGEHILKPSIEGNFRGSKVSLATNKKEILETISTMKRFAKVMGVPSVNEDNESFQGVDRVVDVMIGDEFGLMVLADPLSQNELVQIEKNLCEIHDKLTPLTKISIQESSGNTTTIGDALTKNESNTEGSSEGDSESHADGESSGTSKGTSESEGYTPSGGGDNYSSSGNSGTNQGQSHTKTTSINKGTNRSTTIGSSTAHNKSTANNTGTNKSREFTNKVINEWVQYIDETLFKRIKYGQNKGVFNVSMYLFANSRGTIIKLGNTLCAIFSGTNENKAPMEISYLSDNDEEHAIKNLQNLLEKTQTNINATQAKLLYSQSNRKRANWMSVNELSVITSLPKKEVVGLSLKEEVEFGLNIKKQALADQERLLLGHLVQSGKTLNIEVAINKAHLNKHTFITGVTGSGKTTTCQRILNSADVPFLVIEPAKTEYRVLTQKYDDILIFTLGDETIAPLRMNPFEFFKGENISSRVDMIKANIEAAFDMEAAIPQIIEGALYACYEKYGWDIATSTNSIFKDPFADGVYAFPTLSDLIAKVAHVTEEQGFDERLKNDYIGSIKARLQGLMVGAKGFMLNTPRSIDFKDIVERNVIFELEAIKNGAEKSLVMGFILINLNEAIKIKHQQYAQQGKTFKHITLIEEAHRLLSKYMAGDNPSKKLGVETFSDMLAEVRKYGESLIIVDQIPNKLTPEVLKNTNTKIVHRLFASDDKEAIGNTMSLNDEQKEFLSNLDVGRAIVSNQDFAKPLQVQIQQLEDISTTTSAIVDEQAVRAIVLTYYAQHYRRGVIPGLQVFEETPSHEQIEAALSGRYAVLTKLWQEVFKRHPLQKLSDALIAFVSKAQLEQSLDFMIKFLYARFYSNNDDKWQAIETHLLSVCKKMKMGDKDLSRVEIAYLRIRRG